MPKIPVEEFLPLFKAEMAKMEVREFDVMSEAVGTLGSRQNGGGHLRTTPLQQIAWQSGVSTKALYELFNGTTTEMLFSTVDKLVSRWLGRPDLWQTEPLSRYYP